MRKFLRARKAWRVKPGRYIVRIPGMLVSTERVYRNGKVIAVVGYHGSGQCSTLYSVVRSLERALGVQIHAQFHDMGGLSTPPLPLFVVVD